MVAYGVLLLVVGLALVLLAVRMWRTRPDWTGLYGKAALLGTVGAFVAVGGFVNLLIS